MFGHERQRHVSERKQMWYPVTKVKRVLSPQQCTTKEITFTYFAMIKNNGVAKRTRKVLLV
jgi:hypothetical protein